MNPVAQKEVEIYKNGCSDRWYITPANLERLRNAYVRVAIRSLA